MDGLTGHENSNGNLMGLVKLGRAAFALKLTTFSPRTGVTTSPYVQDDIVSIFAWYCFKQTRNLVLHTPEHSPVLDALPEQHLPRLSLPYSFTKDFSLSSNIPEALTCGTHTHFNFSRVSARTFRELAARIKKKILEILIQKRSA